MRRVVRLGYFRAKMLFEVGRSVEAQRAVFAEDQLHPLLTKLRIFIFNCKNPKEEIELMDGEVKRAASWMNSLPYRDEKQTNLWRFLMLATKLGALEND